MTKIDIIYEKKGNLTVNIKEYNEMIFETMNRTMRRTRETRMYDGLNAVVNAVGALFILGLKSFKEYFLI